MTEPTPEAWAQIRHAYENTEQPLVDICAAYDVSIPTVRYRMKRWQWTRRKPFVPRQQPPAMAASPDAFFLHPPLEGEGRRAASEARYEPGWGDDHTQQLHPTPPAFADASAVDPPPQERAPGRAQARPGWEGEKSEGEKNIISRLQSAMARVLPAIEATAARLTGGSPRDMEQAGRTLSALTRALRELNALLVQHRGAQPVDEPEPLDIDEFRNELARRIHALIDRYQANARAGLDAADTAPDMAPDMEMAASPATAMDGPART